ncbi:MAG: TRAP transporter small permease [Pseudomonadota bacterium]
MRAILRLLDLVCAFGAAIAALACLSLAVMLIVEVITTSFMAYSQPWAVEYSSYLLAPVLFAGAGWTLGRGGHIRVAVLTQFLPVRGRWLADLLASVFGFGVSLFVALALVEYTARSYEVGSQSTYPTRTPIWMPQAVLTFGWAVLVLGLTARILRLLTGRAAEDAPDTPDLAATAEPDARNAKAKA